MNNEETVAGGALRVRELSDASELRALEGRWAELVEACPEATPFLTPDWVEAWFQTCGANRGRPCVLVFEDEQGLAGLAPFARTRRGSGPLAHRVLESAGSSPLPTLGMGLPDRTGLLLARRAEDCIQTLLNWLAEQRKTWDILDLRFIPADSSAVQGLQAGAAAKGMGLASEECSVSPYLSLDETWQDYLMSRSQRFRKGLKRFQRALEGEGEPSFEVVLAESEVAAALEEAIAVSRGSWKGGSGTALLLHAEVVELLHALLPRMAARGQVYIALLRVDGRAVAHELGFRLGGKLWAYDSCFDGDCPGSPGNLLMARLLEWAFEQGLREYDFMRGDEPYKMRWQPETRRELQLVLDSGSLRAKLVRRLAFQTKWFFKRNQGLTEGWSKIAGVFNRRREGWGRDSAKGAD